MTASVQSPSLKVNLHVYALPREMPSSFSLLLLDTVKSKSRSFKHENNCVALRTNRRLPFLALVLPRSGVLTACASVLQVGTALALAAYVRIV